jgi:hypothetical protein
MVATGLEEAPRVLTIDYRERSAERVLAGARGTELQPRVKAWAKQRSGRGGQGDDAAAARLVVAASRHGLQETAGRIATRGTNTKRRDTGYRGLRGLWPEP